MKKVNYKIHENILKIEREDETIQLNIMSWGNGEAKFDLRRWSDEETPLKGMVLTGEELSELYTSLKEYFEPFDFKFDIEEEDEEDIFIEESHVLDFRKFLIRSSNQCDNMFHSTEKVKAIVNVLTQYGGVQQIELDAVYCSECKCYYISEFQYNKAKSQGRILCQVMSKEQYEEYQRDSIMGELNAESKLHVAGYNLSSGLSQKQRQVILTYVIESGLMTKEEVINHLSFFIRLNESRGIPALEKWRADREFITGHKEGAVKLVGVKYFVE